MGVICEKKNAKRTEREDNQRRKQKHEYTRTYRYFVRGTSHDTWYCCMFERRHSEARHSTAPQRWARHGSTAPHNAALHAAKL